LLPTAATVVVVALTVALGNWQRHRADEKSALAAHQLAMSMLPPADLSGYETDIASLLLRRVRVSGEYDRAHAMLIDNKVHAGRPGFHAIAPLKIGTSGRYVLVDRGWVPQGARRSELPSVPVPAGSVSIDGRANLPPQRYLELGRDPNEGPLWQNLDIGRIAAATRLPLLPFIIEQTDPVTPVDDLVREWPPPDFGVAQHVSYMVQWYSLAALAVVLWLALNWRRRESTDDSPG
jgi:surfeit locus 1 family protein